jgi:hypothetical protein
MKNDIVDDILKVESDAKAMVEKAKSDARDLVYNAQVDASKLVKCRVEQVRNEGNEAVAERQALNEKALEEFKAEMDKQLDNSVLANEELIREAAIKIVSAVSTVAF